MSKKTYKHIWQKESGYQDGLLGIQHPAGRGIVAALFCVLLLTGCSILPEEETVHAMPVIQTTEEEEYVLEAVRIGDVTETQIVPCIYSQVQEEEVAFSVTGKEIEQVFVGTGDTVKKGDVLATLALDDLELEVTELTNTVEMNTLLLAQAEEREQFERMKRELRADEELPEEVKKQYQEEKEDYSDQIYVTQKKLTDVKQKIAEGTLYAGMDGVVSFVRPNLVGSDSMEDKGIIKIINDEQCAFNMDDMEYTNLFTPGETVNVIVDDMEYAAVVQPFDENSESIFFGIEDAALDIKVGQHGKVIVEIDSKKDVKILSMEAIHQSGDTYFVYYVDEAGVRRMKEIGVGFVGDGIAEITDGLENHDEVIK